MLVQPVQSNYYNHNKNTFTSWGKEVKTMTAEGEKLLYRTHTWFYRNEHLWSKFVDFFVKKFENIPKVNVYNYACSDGSEPYTFIMQLLSSYPKEASKFFPIVARDIDKESIERAKSLDYYYLGNDEIENINFNTNNNFSNFFSSIDKMHIGQFAYPKESLYDNVDFKVADINKDYKKIKPNNTILFVRNFWPYIENWWDRQKLLNKLFNRLGENSFIVIGQFDREGTNWTIDNQILEAGFKRTDVDFVFEKPHVEKPVGPIRSIFNKLF